MSRGLYLPREATETQRVADELAAWSLVLPPCAGFTSLSSAELRRWWLPAAIEHPVFVAVPKAAAHPQRPGLFVTRHPRPVPTELVDGLRIATAAETLLAAARDLSPIDLVILGDAALHLGACTVEELWAAAAQRRNGAPRLRTVIPLLNGLSESPWESVLRLLHVAADIEVEPQKVIHDDLDRFVARADLWLVGTRRIHEYDGEVHRDPTMHRADLARDRRLVESGWQRVGFTSAQLMYESAAIITGLDRLLGRTWDPGRLARWESLLNASLLRPAGRARVRARWFARPSA